MSRWDGQRPAWTDFDDREWEALTAHVHENDFPETRAGWHELGRGAGFGEVEELYVCPTDLFRLNATRFQFPARSVSAVS